MCGLLRLGAKVIEGMQEVDPIPSRLKFKTLT